MGTHFNFATTRCKLAVSFNGKRGIAWVVPVTAQIRTPSAFQFSGCRHKIIVR
jgi:hypothetical protein